MVTTVIDALGRTLFSSTPQDRYILTIKRYTAAAENAMKDAPLAGEEVQSNCAEWDA
jgi:hypothetical protein